jgi:release factor glutamine methyltransferase
MDWQQAQKELVSRLVALYEDREAAVITDWVMEHLSGRKRIDRLLHKSDPLSQAEQERLKEYTIALLGHRPIQYVLQESWFCGLKFYVDERVLIPRPETEELVEWVVAEARAAQPDGEGKPGGGKTGTARPDRSAARGVILDVGTGSGCIAVALKRQLPTLDVYGCDVSGDALAIAERNATTLGADLHLHRLDFLDSRQWESLPQVGYLVSNPPYIPLKDKETMAAHVVAFEPHRALFVEDGDPLIFYKALAGFARQKLLPGGNIFVEIHENLASATLDLFKAAGFQQVTLRKDMQGKDRMIKAGRAN